MMISFISRMKIGISVNGEHGSNPEDGSREKQELRDKIQDRVMNLSGRRHHEAGYTECDSGQETSHCHNRLDLGYRSHMIPNSLSSAVSSSDGAVSCL